MIVYVLFHCILCWQFIKWSGVGGWPGYTQILCTCMVLLPPLKPLAEHCLMTKYDHLFNFIGWSTPLGPPLD